MKTEELNWELRGHGQLSKRIHTLWEKSEDSRALKREQIKSMIISRPRKKASIQFKGDGRSEKKKRRRKGGGSGRMHLMRFLGGKIRRREG